MSRTSPTWYPCRGERFDPAQAGALLAGLAVPVKNGFPQGMNKKKGEHGEGSVPDEANWQDGHLPSPPVGCLNRRFLSIPWKGMSPRVTRFMDQNRTQSRQQQRRRDTYAEQVEITDDDILNEGEYEYDDVWPTRMPTSARRYQGLADVRTEVGRAQADVEPFPALRTSRVAPSSKSAIPARRSATQTNIPAVQGNRRSPVGIASNVGSPNTEDIPPQRRIMQGLRVHWLLFVGLAMLIMIIGWIAFNALANWWQVTQDDWHYGRPRTFQTDAVVGHNDSASHPSHFIALNLNRRIQIIEFPGGDSTKAKIYLGPVLIGQGQDLAVVTLSFKDVNGDGKPDMIVNVQDSRFVFINDGGAFRPARPGENIQL